MAAPKSNLKTLHSLRSYLQKIDEHASSLGVNLNKKSDMENIIADVNDPIKDYKLGKLELFCLYLHARQEVLCNYLINEDEEYNGVDSEPEEPKKQEKKKIGLKVETLKIED